MAALRACPQAPLNILAAGPHLAQATLHVEQVFAEPRLGRLQVGGTQPARPYQVHERAGELRTRAILLANVVDLGVQAPHGVLSFRDAPDCWVCAANADSREI